MQRPQQPLLDDMLQRIQPQLHTLRAQQLCKVLWALGSLRLNPGAAWLEAAAQQCLDRIDDLDAQGISTVLYVVISTLVFCCCSR